MQARGETGDHSGQQLLLLLKYQNTVNKGTTFAQQEANVLIDGRFFVFQVNGKTLKFKAAVVATGGSAALPPIPGLKEAPYLTNASIFNLTKLPRRLVSLE